MRILFFQSAAYIRSATVPLARSGVPQGSQLCCCAAAATARSQGCSFLRGRTPGFPGALGRSRALSGALGVSRVGLRDGDPASKGPLTGQDGPKRLLRWPKRAPNRSKIAPRRPRWPPDGTRGLQDAPRSLQEASQEGPKRPKSLIFLRFLSDFSVFAFSAFPRSKTA